jgi:hypothetical protein
MKQFKKFPKEENKMKQFLKVYLSLLLLLTLAFAASPGSVWAITAANTQIINQAQLSYNDGTGTQIKTATVTVTVSLVPSAPTIVAGGPYSTNYAIGAFLTDTFTITSTSNGPDTYNLSAATGTQVNNGNTGTAAMASGSSIVIGATVTVGISTVSAITVPSDGVNDGSVNGITTGDTVIISGVARTVASVVDNVSGTSTINLSVALGSAPAAGIGVFGQKTVTVTDTAGTIVTPGITVEVPAHITATSNTDNSKTTTSSDAQNYYYSGLAGIIKYVRNVTTPIVGGTSASYGGNTYYVTGVTAKPGEVLEYLLVCTNSGTGPVTASVVTDGLATAYVTFKVGEYTGGKDIIYVNALSTASYLTAAAGDDAGVYVASTLTVNVGTGAGIPPAAGGTLAAGDIVRVLYQVTVNP